MAGGPTSSGRDRQHRVISVRISATDWISRYRIYLTNGTEDRSPRSAVPCGARSAECSIRAHAPIRELTRKRDDPNEGHSSKSPRRTTISSLCGSQGGIYVAGRFVIQSKGIPNGQRADEMLSMQIWKLDVTYTTSSSSGTQVYFHPYSLIYGNQTDGTNVPSNVPTFLPGQVSRYLPARNLPQSAPQSSLCGFHDPMEGSQVHRTKRHPLETARQKVKIHGIRLKETGCV